MTGNDQLLGRAIQVVTDVQVGLLTTVDATGRPHARFMAARAESGLGRIITLTAGGTEKVQNLRAHDAVCWVFARPDLSDVVTLYGRAKVLSSPLAAAAAWDHLFEAVRTYAVGPLSNDNDLTLVVIETHVESGDIISPPLDLFTPQPLHIHAA